MKGGELAHEHIDDEILRELARHFRIEAEHDQEFDAELG